MLGGTVDRHWVSSVHILYGTSVLPNPFHHLSAAAAYVAQTAWANQHVHHKFRVACNVVMDRNIPPIIKGEIGMHRVLCFKAGTTLATAEETLVRHMSGLDQCPIKMAMNQLLSK